MELEETQGRKHLPSHRRRETHDLIVAILKLATKGQRKTRIMYRSGLSYSQLKRLLDYLEISGLIWEESGIWKTTDEGVDIIEACELCRRISYKIRYFA